METKHKKRFEFIIFMLNCSFFNQVYKITENRTKTVMAGKSIHRLIHRFCE